MDDKGAIADYTQAIVRELFANVLASQVVVYSVSSL
jgi:hypothetical protein